VPGAGDVVNIFETDGVSRTITYDYTGAAVKLAAVCLNLTGGNGSSNTALSISANNLTANFEIVGDSAANSSGTGLLNQSGGSNSVQQLNLGDYPGDNGTYSLSGGSLLAYTEYVGCAGSTFRQSGGSNILSNDLVVAYGSNSTGSYTLSGNGTLSTPQGYESIGDTGTGNMVQIGGTNTPFFITLGWHSGSSGSYILSGGSLTTSNMYVGGDSSAGGRGNLDVANLGNLVVSGTLKIWNTTGSSVTLEGGSIQVGTLDTSGNPGLLNWTAGTLTITGGPGLKLGITSDCPLGSSLTLSVGQALKVSSNGGLWASQTTSSVTVNGGQAYSSDFNLPQLTVASGTAAVLASASYNVYYYNNIPTLTVVGQGTFDLTNNGLITNDPVGVIQAYLRSGAIFSSMPNGNCGVGYADAGQGQVDLHYSLLGATDLNGNVNVADLANLAGNFGASTGAFWISGDFDYNGNVNVADLADLAGNFGKDLTSSGLAVSDARPASASAVPEPAGLALLFIAAGEWVTRRHRHRSRGTGDRHHG
jgi:hypothetical protein